MTSFRLALELLCYYLPKTQILVSSCQYTANEAYNQNAIKQFNAEQEKLCAESSIQYIPLYREMGINKVNHSTWLKNDNLHPNEDGEVLYTEYFRNRLNQNLVLRSGLYEVTAEANPAEGGEVTGAGTFNYGETIQIAATANLGFTFVSWDDGNTDNPREIVVTQDQTFTALFDIKQCFIKTFVLPEGAGEVVGGGVYNYGEIITLTAHSNGGYVFSHWSDDEIANPRRVFVECDTSYVAIFNPLQYEITTECDPVEGGTVSGAGTYEYGSVVTLTATPNENYTFLCWSDGIVTNPRNITVTGNANYKALFHHDGTMQYTITVVANDPLLGTVTGSGIYPEGVTIDISATPNEGAVFVSWNDGNTDNPRSVTVTGDMAFTAITSSSPSSFLARGAQWYPPPAYWPLATERSSTSPSSHTSPSTVTRQRLWRPVARLATMPVV